MEIKPYLLKGRFKNMCQMYRWVKFNYLSVYVNVCAYTYSAPIISEVVLQESSGKKPDQHKDIAGQMQLNISNFGPIMGRNHDIWLES